MPAPPPLADVPIITLLSDFGLRDAYVAEMKAAILRNRRDAVLIDITHMVPRHDVLCGSISLQRAIAGFPAGTIHVAVVDPGVGTDRRIILAEINKQHVICPDNGLITWAFRTFGGSFREISWRPEKFTSTFHGRDVMAPVAAMLADGIALDSVSREIESVTLLDVAPAVAGTGEGQIIQIDSFGNATTNIPAEMVCDGRAKSIRAGGHNLGRLRKTYWDVPPGKPLALIGSSGLLEIAVRDGSASEEMKLAVGDRVEFL